MCGIHTGVVCRTDSAAVTQDVPFFSLILSALHYRVLRTALLCISDVQECAKFCTPLLPRDSRTSGSAAMPRIALENVGPGREPKTLMFILTTTSGTLRREQSSRPLGRRNTL